MIEQGFRLAKEVIVVKFGSCKTAVPENVILKPILGAVPPPAPTRQIPKIYVLPATSGKPLSVSNVAVQGPVGKHPVVVPAEGAAFQATPFADDILQPPERVVLKSAKFKSQAGSLAAMLKPKVPP